jgi:hypothetical protein
MNTSTRKRSYVLPAFVLFCLSSAFATAQSVTAYNPANGHLYSTTTTATTYVTARNQAVAAGGWLASIESAAEQAFIASAFSSVLATQSVWIGLNDLAVEGSFVWESGASVIPGVSYTNWQPGEPNNLGDEDAVEMLTNADSNRWNDRNASSTRIAIIEIPPTTNPANGRLCHLTYATFTLAGARALATTMGGHLVTIDDAATQAFIVALAAPALSQPGGGSTPGVWIGLADDATEGVFAWDDGTPFAPGTSYSNWGAGQPDGGTNGGGGSGQIDGVRMRNDSNNNVWDDVDVASLYRAVIQIVPPPPPPANDACTNAEPVFVGDNPAAPSGAVGAVYTNVNATNSSFAAPCGFNGSPGYGDVFFSFVAPTTTDYVLHTYDTFNFPNTDPTTLNDTILEVYPASACSSGGAPIACNDDFTGNLRTGFIVNFGFRSAVFVRLTAGQSYLIRVSSWSSTTRGTFRLTIAPLYTLVLESPNGPGSLRVSVGGGTPGRIYLNVFTLTAGSFPSGHWFGISPTYFELTTQFAAGTPPFLGLLDGAGSALAADILGAPPITLYAVAVELDLLGNITNASAPVSYAIP